MTQDWHTIRLLHPANVRNLLNAGHFRNMAFQFSIVMAFASLIFAY